MSLVDPTFHPPEMRYVRGVRGVGAREDDRKHCQFANIFPLRPAEPAVSAYFVVVSVHHLLSQQLCC